LEPRVGVAGGPNRNKNSREIRLAAGDVLQSTADHWVVPPAGAVVPSVVAGSVVSVSVVDGVVVVLGVVVVVVSPLHPATNIAIQTNINANKLLIARSPENEMVSKTLAPSREARI
jgi:hypothetical protein